MINALAKSLFYDRARLERRLFQMQLRASAILRAIRASRRISYPYTDQVNEELCKLTGKDCISTKAEVLLEQPIIYPIRFLVE